jgi:hypothetical protein
MKKFLVILLINGISLIGFTKQIQHLNQWKNCKQIKTLLNSTSENPIFQFKTQENFDSIQLKLATDFGQDFLDKNPSFPVKIPLSILKHKILFDARITHSRGKTDSLSHCLGQPNRHLNITLNSAGVFLINENFYDIDSIQNIVSDYLQKFMLSDDYGEFSESRIFISWTPTKPSIESLSQTFQHICFGYIDFIQKNSDQNICNLSKKELLKLRDLYPLTVTMVLRENMYFKEIIIFEDTN